MTSNDLEHEGERPDPVLKLLLNFTWALIIEKIRETNLGICLPETFSNLSPNTRGFRPLACNYIAHKLKDNNRGVIGLVGSRMG